MQIEQQHIGMPPAQVHPGLVDLRVQHPLALDPERELELVGGEIKKIIGLIKRSARVEIAARPGDVFVDGAARNVLGAFKHQVLKEVGEPGPVRSLVFASHMIQHVAGDDRRAVVFMQDHVQSIGQVVFDEADRLQNRFMRRGCGQQSGVILLIQFFIQGNLRVHSRKRQGNQACKSGVS